MVKSPLYQDHNLINLRQDTPIYFSLASGVVRTISTVIYIFLDLLQPYKERPKTTNLVANRLVAGALGVKSKMSREEKQNEREKIKAERGK